MHDNLQSLLTLAKLSEDLGRTDERDLNLDVMVRILARHFRAREITQLSVIEECMGFVLAAESKARKI